MAVCRYECNEDEYRLIEAAKRWREAVQTASPYGESDETYWAKHARSDVVWAYKQLVEAIEAL